MMTECELSTDIVRCAVMMLLYEKPLHGYAIIEALKGRLGRAVSPAIVYPFLAQLLKAGYLTAGREDLGRRARLVYSMTPRGRRFSERVFKRLSQIVSTALEPGILRCAHCGTKLYEPGHTERVGGKRLVFCCEHCARAYRLNDRFLHSESN
jgi:DNA-binding PadR family transcriptional regulator